MYKTNPVSHWLNIITVKFFINAFFVLAIIFASCNPFSGPAFPEPRNVEWKKVWEKNQAKLKALTQDILVKENKKYTAGINDFPSGFDYPFDDGFFIETPFPNNETDGFDAKKITIKFYVDRGLLDHYSAFIFTNDSSSIEELDGQVENGGNDFKIELNWYIIND